MFRMPFFANPLVLGVPTSFGSENTSKSHKNPSKCVYILAMLYSSVLTISLAVVSCDIHWIKNKLTNFFVKSKGLPKLVGTSVECEARCNIVKRIGENGRRSILSIYQALQVHIDNCSSQIIRKVIFSSWLPKMSWMHLLGNHYYLHNAFCSSLWRYSSHHLCTKCHLSHKISLMAKSKHFQLT